MLVGEEFLDADEAHKLLYGVHFALCSAGWQRCDIRPAPVKVEAAVVEKLERGIELLSRFEEQAGGAVVDDQAGGKPAEDRRTGETTASIGWRTFSRPGERIVKYSSDSKVLDGLRLPWRRIVGTTSG